MRLSEEFGQKAQAVNSIAVDVGRETLARMGTRLPASGLLTTSCPPYRTARKTMVNLSNAALRLWELACVARQEEAATPEDTGAVMEDTPNAEPATVDGPGQGEPIGVDG